MQLEVGDRVAKRGYTHEGTVALVSSHWVQVDWDEGIKPKERPKWCSPGELRPIDKT